MGRFANGVESDDHGTDGHSSDDNVAGSGQRDSHIPTPDRNDILPFAEIPESSSGSPRPRTTLLHRRTALSIKVYSGLQPVAGPDGPHHLEDREMKRFLVLLVGSALIVTSGGVANADMIYVNATVRDFTTTHADFDQSIIAQDYAIVGSLGSAIGAGRKPVYAAAGSTATVASQASFNQWWTDNSYSTTIPIALDNGMAGPGGIYTYDDSTFFPIDGQLRGNERRPHNYHFTVEMHTSFMYQTGQVFQYTADDDLFVYVNDKLVVDGGGVWPARSYSVNLDTLGLTPGQVYAYDIFFAERHTVDSRLRFDAAMVPVPGAVLLGALGLTAAGLQLRKHA